MFFLQHNMRRRKMKKKNKNFSSFNFQKSFRFDFLFISILNGLKYHVRVFRNENIIHIYICVLFYCSFQIPIICHGIVNIFSLKSHTFYGKKKSIHTQQQKTIWEGNDSKTYSICVITSMAELQIYNCILQELTRECLQKLCFCNHKFSTK